MSFLSSLVGDTPRPQQREAQCQGFLSDLTSKQVTVHLSTVGGTESHLGQIGGMKPPNPSSSDNTTGDIMREHPGATFSTLVGTEQVVINPSPRTLLPKAQERLQEAEAEACAQREGKRDGQSRG